MTVNNNPLHSQISRNLQKARAKHPEFVYNNLHYLCTIVEEVCEYAFAVCFQSKQRADEEMVDIIVLMERKTAGDGTIHVPWWNPVWIIRAWTKENRGCLTNNP